MTKPAMTTKELEARCRQAIAELVAQGQAGRLDAAVYAALRTGLAARGRAAAGVLSAPKRKPADGE